MSADWHRVKYKSDVLKISFSAFFADLGYQAAVALFPLVVVVVLHAPISLYGLIEGINYGGGIMMGLLGGVLADRYGAKRVAIVGNALIVVIGFTGIAKDLVQAVAAFMTGWFARNFRSPPRRVMMLDVTYPEERKEAFGVLHALDILGASLALVYVTLGLYLKVDIALLTLPAFVTLIVSTLLLVFVKGRGLMEKKTSAEAGKKGGKLLAAVIASTALFAFSQYSFGFPIITTYEVSRELYLATATYLVFLLTSSAFGYVFGKVKVDEVKGLALFGYFLAGLGSLGFAFLSGYGVSAIWLSSVVMGIAVAATEVYEPTIVSAIAKREGLGMGLLSMGRSIGIFLGNAIMGFLYQFGYAYSYTFAALMSFVAGLVVYLVSRK